jgi:hypothetical protein
MKIGFRCGRWPRPRGVPLAMEMDEAFNPIEVSLLGAEGILLDPNSVADAVEQTRSGRPIHCCRFRFHYWPLAR